jgi:hypothetical protein
MFNVLTIEDSKRKSSRSKADLFEVLVVIELSQYYGFNTDGFKKEKDKLEHEISKFRNGNRRTEEQYKRAKILIPPLIKKLDTEVVPIYGRPSEIKWIGRRWQEEATLSDIEIDFKSNNSIGISLKSTRQGKGTQKNIGYDKLNQLLGVDLDRELNEMWSRIREDLSKKGSELSQIAQKAQKAIKDAKYKYPVIQKIGKEYGFTIQKLAVDQSIILFNRLPKKRKLIFLEEIFGIESTKQLLNVLVEGEIPKLYWNETAQNLIKGNLLAKKLKDKSYCITANGKPIVRLQASFTNGIGLSAFCERAFLLTDY